MDQERFDRIRNAVLCSDKGRGGIGTYKEKTLHAILKDYYAPDKSMQEIPVNGYIVDIFTGEEILEIQTGNFDKMRMKLDKLLMLYPITIIYPVPGIKYLLWIDEETGECSKPRKSTVKGSVYRAFYELYKIKKYLLHPNLTICLPILEIREYRLLNGWSRDRKKGSCRYDRVPERILDEVYLKGIEDYYNLIPKELAKPFTVKEFGKAVGERKEVAARALYFLRNLKVVSRYGKSGREYTYVVNRKKEGESQLYENYR